MALTSITELDERYRMPMYLLAMNEFSNVRTRYRMAATLTLLFACASSYAQQQGPILAAWTQLTGAAPSGGPSVSSKGAVSVRVITTAASCPEAEVDGQRLELRVRQPQDNDFAVTTCEADASPQARRIMVAGRNLYGWPRRLRRIVVIGDTGCRLKGPLIQDCNDPRRWPFASVAAQAAAKRPDLVIHVGDYYYRESPCPKGAQGCAGSPHGDAWPSWQADFFAPVQPLLGAAPWIYVRGNHEQCGRGANGWFRFLDAAPEPQRCADSITAVPFTVRVDGLTMNVMDSADTDDTTAPPALVALFRKQFEQLGKAVEEGHGWILTHRPIWGLDPHNVAELTAPAYKGKATLPSPLPNALAGFAAIDLPSNRSEQVAADAFPLSGTDMVISGHVHLFTTLAFGPARPVQLIVGNGGDNPNIAVAGPAERKEEVDGKQADVYQLLRYGFFVLDRRGKAWAGTAYSVDGSVLGRCRFSGRAASCRLSAQLPLQPLATQSEALP